MIENAPIRFANLRVWECLALRISQLAERSQAQYISILRDFCQVLRIEAGTRAGAERLVSVTEREVLIYRTEIETQPGMTPREMAAIREETKTIDPMLIAPVKASKATVSRKLIVMRALYKSLQLAGFISANPFQFARIPKAGAEKRRVNIALPAHKVLEMFEACQGYSDPAVQDRAILAVFFGGGLRRSEVAEMRIGDIKRSATGVTYIRLSKTKAQVEQLQPIPEWAARMLETWIEIRRKYKATDLDFVFCGATKKMHRPGINGKTLSLRLKKLAKIIGINPALISAHTARHTAITELLNQNNNLIAVQNFARHESINTTLKYNHSGKDLEENAALKLNY